MIDNAPTQKEIKSGLGSLSMYDMEGTFQQAIEYLKEKERRIKVAFPQYHSFILDYDHYGYNDERTLNIIGVRLETEEEVKARIEMDKDNNATRRITLLRHREAIEAELKRIEQSNP